MTNPQHRHDSPRYQTPDSIRDETFQRRMRGLDADKVYGYLDLLADQVQATEGQLKASRAENERLKAEVQRTQAELRRVQTELDEYEQVGDRVNEQVVQLFSQAQLVAEEMVEEVSRDARERLSQARAHERQIVSAAMDTAGEQIRSYARTAQAQMKSAIDSFATEVERLGGEPQSGQPLSGEPRSVAPHEIDPLFADLNNWPTHLANGRGPKAPGSDRP
ncbi:DivIVA domain-containing protein [Kribbella sp. CWNU-51]